MKLLLAGPLDPKHKADAAMRSALDALSTTNVDAYLMPTSAMPPLSTYACGLLGKTLLAPFDAALIVHDIARIRLSADVFNAAPTRIAYLVSTNSPNALKGLKDRLAPFTYVIPASQAVANMIEGTHPSITEPTAIGDVIDHLATLPGIEWDTDTTAKNEQPFEFRYPTQGLAYSGRTNADLAAQYR